MMIHPKHRGRASKKLPKACIFLIPDTIYYLWPDRSKQAADDETWRERGLRPGRVLAAARFSAVLMCRPTPIADPPSFKQAVISSIKS